MKVTSLTEIGKHRPLCEAKVRVAASGATHSAERRAYVARKAGYPVDQCGTRGDFRVDGKVLCRQHAQARALEHVMANQP